MFQPGGAGPLLKEPPGLRPFPKKPGMENPFSPEKPEAGPQISDEASQVSALPAAGNGKRRFRIALALLCSLVILEAAARLFFPAQTFRKALFEAFGGSYRMSENPGLVYAPTPYAGENNSYGHRGPEHAFSRSGKRRLVFLGSDITEGAGLPVTVRFSELMGSHFGDRYDFINLGVAGHGLFQQAEYLEAQGVRFSPDTVIWIVAPADLAPKKSPAAAFVEKSPRGAFYRSYYGAGAGRFLYRSAIFRLLSWYFSGRADGFNPAAEARMAEPEFFSRQLKSIKKLASRKKFQAVFILLPSPSRGDDPNVNLFRLTLGREGFPFLDLYALVKASPPKGGLAAFLQAGSPDLLNALGHEYLARVIMALAEDGSLP